MSWQQAFSSLHQLPLLLAQNSDKLGIPGEDIHPVTETARWWYEYLNGVGIGKAWIMPLALTVVVLIGLVLPMLLGAFLARSLKMRDYGFKLGVIFSSVALALCIVALMWPPKLGIDLKGGVILIYEITGAAEETEEGTPGQQGDVDVASLIDAIGNRINPSGLKEVVIRPYGERQVEIIIPEVNEAEVDNIKRSVATAGFLRFHIVADPAKHADVIELAEKQKEARDVVEEFTTDSESFTRVVGTWARVGRDEKAGPDGIRNLKVSVVGSVIRDAETNEWLDVPSEVLGSRDSTAVEKWLRDRGTKEIDILMAVDPNPAKHVMGKHLESVMRDVDSRLNPQVSFIMTSEGAVLMSQLTSANLPEGQRFSRLGIVLDGTLLSAPRIQSTIAARGRITGQFTQEEVDFLVGILKAGRLPATLNKTPISESQIDPLLGVATIRQGTYAIGISLVAVLAFMLVYYRFSGVVACLALVANLVLILGVMMLVKAAFTLPGLAGLVLTVGMSVDANVLIFERIREEVNRGSALRMAIRNGFSRATTTIVDANLTTLITAIVLYAIGTDQVRGFAVTLILGILMSMYTAIFCSRAIFDIGERKRWISKLGMMSLVGSTQIDFIGKRRIAVSLSIIVILIGLVGVVLRGKNIFDIDFNGGSSVQVTLVAPISDTDMRRRLGDVFDDPQEWESIRNQVNNEAVAQLRAMGEDELGKVAETLKMSTLDADVLAGMSEEEILALALHAKYGENFESPQGRQDYTVNGLPREGKKPDTAYKVDTSIQSAEYLKDILRIVFHEGDHSLLESYKMKYEPLVAKVTTPTPPPPSETPETTPSTDGGTTPSTDGGTTPSTDGETTPSTSTDGATTPSGGAFVPSGGEKTPEKPSDDSPPSGGNADAGTSGKETPAPETPASDTPAADTSGSDTPASNTPDTDKPEPDTPKADKPGDDKPGDDEGASLSAGQSFVLFQEPSLTGPKDESSAAQADASDNPETKTEEKPKENEPQPGEKPDDNTKAEEKPASDQPPKSAGDQSKEKPTPPSDTKPADGESDQPAKTPAGEPPKSEAPKSEAPKSEAPKSEAPESSEPASEPDGEGSQAGAPEAAVEAEPSPIMPEIQTSTTVNFAEHKVNYVTLVDKLRAIGQELFERDINPHLQPRGEGAEDWTTESNLGFLTWEITLDANEDEARQVLDRIKQEFSNTAVWTSSSKIGGQVARDTQGYAIMALLVSLAGIVGYIWWRFQKVMFGLAAVVALVHDVLITLGAIALSYWFASALGFLMIDQFKISLPVVAALLTIIGYSLNDTIVVFDRIREVRGKSPDLTAEMINTSINQTLSRTLLTSLTTFLVVVILYFIGGTGIHAFAFCLVVGVLVGTYSSIYVASPFLLWMAGAKGKQEKAA
jgi:protein-export membrane protein SecD/preprotein translocase SecF subunit